MSEFDAKAFLKTVSTLAGVYRMYDASDTVIYVGKAKNLKNRLASYFRDKVDRIKTEVLVRQIARIEVTVTDTEAEALVLEHNLIKQYMPRYNVLLRDDKSYPYLLLTAHQHPRLTLHRGARKPQGEYFGPYPNGYAVRETLHLMQKLLPIRQCEDSYYRNRSRPCLQYQIKRCLGPCVAGLVSDEEYQQQVDYVRLFLRGQSQQVVSALVTKMEQASQALAFEQAARYRDQIQALQAVAQQQYVTASRDDSFDVVGFALTGGDACVQVLFFRQGQLLGSRSYFPRLSAIEDNLEALCQGFINQFYLNNESGREIPAQILLAEPLPDNQVLEQALSSVYQRKIQLLVPKRGEKTRFIELATRNAEQALAARIAHKSTIAQRFALLAEELGLGQAINRMECFDISHTQGERTVASCVVFNQDGPAKNDYRLYHIEGITGGDDYAAMRQVLQRRFEKQLDEAKIPDIIFIDGGVGQLRQAEEVFAGFSHLSRQPLLIGVAKGESRKAGLETLILADNHETLNLASHSPALHLIQHIRDEAHRFAISGHRARREKARQRSVLEDIAGIGAKKRAALLKYFGGLQAIERASVDALAQVPGISNSLAQSIYDALRAR